MDYLCAMDLNHAARCLEKLGNPTRLEVFRLLVKAGEEGLAVGAIQEVETALYFSTVTFTTLGYGDVTLDPEWRLLAAIQAANGTIMFGWTTAIVMAVIHRIAVEREAAAA